MGVLDKFLDIMKLSDDDDYEDDDFFDDDYDDDYEDEKPKKGIFSRLMKSDDDDDYDDDDYIEERSSSKRSAYSFRGRATGSCTVRSPTSYLIISLCNFYLIFASSAFTSALSSATMAVNAFNKFSACSGGRA